MFCRTHSYTPEGAKEMLSCSDCASSYQADRQSRKKFFGFGILALLLLVVIVIVAIVVIIGGDGKTTKTIELAPATRKQPLLNPQFNSMVQSQAISLEIFDGVMQEETNKLEWFDEWFNVAYKEARDASQAVSAIT